jgi:hypothetical protein
MATAHFYEVIVADNSRYMDVSEFYVEGCRHSYCEAVHLAQSIIDAELNDLRRPSHDWKALMDVWWSWGLEPFIRPDPPEGQSKFYGPTYAEFAARRCVEQM